MKPPESMPVVSCLHVTLPRGVQHQIQPSPLSLSTSLARIQGAGLEQRLRQDSTQSPNYNKSSDVDLSVLHYTDRSCDF